MNEIDKGCICQRCDNEFKVDLIIPNDLWKKIKPKNKSKGGGLLCGLCIMKAIEDEGNFDAFELKHID
jgi:hypothetical protein